MVAKSSTSSPPERIPYWTCLGGPALVLLIEVMSLTPLVEFTRGPMARAADSLVLAGGILALACFYLMLAGRGSELAQVAQPRPRGRAMFFWGLAHAALFAAFFAMSLALDAQQHRDSTPWLLAAGWLGLGAAVVGSAYLTVLPAKQMFALLRCCSPQFATAALLGVGTILLIPPVRELWPSAQGPLIKVLGVMLDAYPGHAVSFLDPHGWPNVGVHGVKHELVINVTPACSEMDALLAFFLLGGTLWVVRGSELRPMQYAAVLALGAGVLYLLNAARLYAVILVGLSRGGADAAVRFAHSRIGGILFLAVSLVMLYYGARFAQRPQRADRHSWRKRARQAPQVESEQETQPAETVAASVS